MKYWFRECPKCHGDLREDSDRYGDYVVCLQCGYPLKHVEEVQLKTTGTLQKRKLAEPARRL